MFSLGENSSALIESASDLFTPVQPRRTRTIFLRSSCTEIGNSLNLHMFVELPRDFLQEILSLNETAAILHGQKKATSLESTQFVLCV